MRCGICAKRLKLVETITNKCKHCEITHCSIHKLPFKHKVEQEGHICDSYIESIQKQKELDLKNKFFKRKLEEI